MIDLVLKRFHEDRWGTPGILYGDNLILTTMERKWENNAADISRIPDGVYRPKRTISPRFGETFLIPVENRSNILFHKGNLAMAESKGCILLGSGFDVFDKEWGITSSGPAFSKFIKYLAGQDEFQLVIKSV